MLPSSSVRKCSPALAVGAAGMVTAWLSGEASGLLAVLMAVYICKDSYSTMLSIGICGLALVLFFFLPGLDLPPDVKVYLRFTALVTAVIAIGLLIREKERATSKDHVGWHDTTIDIDDHKEAEKVLRSSEMQLRQLIDALPALVWSTTPEGEPCYLNKRMIDYTGITLDSFGGSINRPHEALAMRTLVHPDDLADQERLCSNSVQAGDSIQTRYRLRRADGVYRWVDARVDLLRDADGQIVQWYGVCVDIDDSQKAEAALRDSEASLRSILDNVPGMIATADPHGRLDYANKRDLDYFKVEMSDLAGHNFINVIHPEEREATMTAWLHAVQTGEPTDFHHRFRRHDGVYRWFNSRVEPAFDQHGKVVRWYGLFTDVDERQHAEDALRNTERQLRLLIDAIPALVWCATPDGEPCYFNKRMIDYTGVTLASFGGSVNRPCKALAMRTLVHPDDLADQERICSYSFQAGDSIRTKYRLRRADGVYRWVDARVDPFRDADGHIVQWYGVCVDIDDSQKAEAALRDSEQQLRLLVDTIPALVWCASPNGAPYYFNKRLTDYTGATLGSSDLSADESRPSPTMRAVYHPDEIDELRRRWFHCVRTGDAFSMSYRLRRADGVYRWVDSRAEPLHDHHGRIVRWYGVFADVDERQHAEEALRSTERQLRLLIDAIPALVWCATPDGEPSYLNKRMIDFTGLPLDSFEPLQGGSLGSLARLAIVHPDELAELEQLWSHSVQTGAALSMRHRLRRVDGAYHWVDLRAEPLRNDDGDIVQWYGVCVDIEVETRMQDELRSAQAKLSRASQAAGLAELSASIAHEVNQPLAAVIANSHACQRWLSTEPPNLQRARVTLERIIRDANGAAEVVCGIRALFKQAVSTRDAINLNEVITEVCKLIGDDVAKKNIGIEIDLERNLPSTLVDRVQMQQVLVNLTRNGIDAMESSTEHPKSLLIRSRRDGIDKVLVEVRDRGSGVEDVERIFEPFFTTKENGMGMGLAICRSIIEAHDGHLWATKSEPRGTTFTFTLPAYSGVSQ
jgi:PAS domain S-box-containing protein